MALNGISGGGSGSSGTTLSPTNFSSVMAGANVSMTWSAPPASVSSTEIWTSSDGVNFTLNTTVAAPGSSSSYAPAQFPSYVIARFKVGTAYGPFTALQSVPSGRDWAARVVLNGGAAPAAATQTAIDTFISGLSTNGILNKFYTINVIAPDNLTAASTPLYNYLGLDPWVNNGPFVGADLTVNGLVGNGASKYFNLGFGPQDCILSAIGGNPNSDFGMDAYCSVATATNSCEIGAAGADFNQAVNFYVQFGGTTYWDCPYNAGNGRISVVHAGNVFNIANRSAANAQQIYDYSSGLGFRTLITGAVNNAGAASAAVNFYAFRNNQAAPQYSDKRLSYIAIRKGFTLAQTQAYALLVQNLRVDLGGGYI